MELIFVYNAKSGLFNKATDFAHKLVSPKTYNCSLCCITYGNFSVHNEWAEFIKSLKMPVKFLYKNDFEGLFPNIFTIYPVIYLAIGNSMLKLLTASEIGEVNKSGHLTDLIKLIEFKIQNNHNYTTHENI